MERSPIVARSGNWHDDSITLIMAISIDEAYSAILQTASSLEPVRVSLGDALNACLAEDLVSPIDSPPFDKALMDGFALRAADFSSEAVFEVVETISAGRVPERSIGSRECARIMTGAPLPVGADCVIRLEDARNDDGPHSDRNDTSTAQRVKFELKRCDPEMNLLRRGTSVRVGQSTFSAGMQLTAARIGALAELGQASVAVHRRPVAAILATGDELTPIDVVPGPGQIRNSNEAMLAAQLATLGTTVRPQGIARDDAVDLRRKIDDGLAADLLVLSGGVSAGQRDLVPSALAAAGVRMVFHGVEIKPGKPLWFGARPADDSRRRCLVFGLPGNPVSSLVCASLFVQTAVRALSGFREPVRPPSRAKLTHEFVMKGDRPLFHPATICDTPDGAVVSLVAWHGSADLCGTIAANGTAFFPPAPRTYSAGDSVPVHAW